MKSNFFSSKIYINNDHYTSFVNVNAKYYIESHYRTVSLLRFYIEQDSTAQQLALTRAPFVT